MNKKIKIFKNETKIYNGNCYVNTVIFRGRIYDEFKKVGQDGIKFSLQLSNGKERVVAPTESRTKFGENNNPSCSRIYSDKEKSLERWRKPTFADCTAFGETAKRRVPPWDKSRLRFFKFRVASRGDGKSCEI